MRSLKGVKIKRFIKSIDGFIIGKWYNVLNMDGEKVILFQYSHHKSNEYIGFIRYDLYDMSGSYFYYNNRYDYNISYPVCTYAVGDSNRIVIASYKDVSKYFNI